MKGNPESMTTQGFFDNVTWEPFIDGNRVGFKVTRVADDTVTYVYLNPSTEGEGQPDVFVYSGPHDDPANDRALAYFVPEFKE